MGKDAVVSPLRAQRTARRPPPTSSRHGAWFQRDVGQHQLRVPCMTSPPRTAATSTPSSPGPATCSGLRRAHLLCLAGLPADIIAGRLRKLFGRPHPAASRHRRTPAPSSITYAATISADRPPGRGEMTDQELTAVATATPRPTSRRRDRQPELRTLRLRRQQQLSPRRPCLPGPPRPGRPDQPRDRTDQSRPRLLSPARPDHPGSRGTRRRARIMHTPRRFRTTSRAPASPGSTASATPTKPGKRERLSEAGQAPA